MQNSFLEIFEQCRKWQDSLIFQAYKFRTVNTFSLGILCYLFIVAVFPCLQHREVKDAKKKEMSGSL